MADKLDELKSNVEEIVLSWPGVKRKEVFGHPGFVRGNGMFAFFPDKGEAAFKAATSQEAETLYASNRAKPFVYNVRMQMRAWPVLPLRTDADLQEVLTRMRSAYDSIR